MTVSKLKNVIRFLGVPTALEQINSKSVSLTPSHCVKGRCVFLGSRMKV